jgi:hypothetical protein
MRLMLPSSKTIGTSRVESTSIGTSRRMSDPEMSGGAMSAVTPRMRPRFAMLEPTTLPSAMALLPASAARIVTASSGALVA